MAEGFSLLELRPLLAAKHQARAHCAYGLQTPIVGDAVYGELSLSYGPPGALMRDAGRGARNNEFLEAQGLLLHARELAMQTFGGKLMRVAAPLPPPFREAFGRLGWTDLAARVDEAARRGTR